MATIVGGFGVPHTPFYPLRAREDTPFANELLRLYGEVADRIRAIEPDVLIIFSTDHFNTFFSDLPVFSIGVSETTYGPNDRPELPAYDIRVDLPLAAHLHQSGVRSGFDITLSQDFTLDHTFVVPYHFLAADLNIPIVPVFVSGLVRPIPSAERCRALGDALANAVHAFPDDKRVGILASGSFSLDLGGIHEGTGDGGVPDPIWVDEIVAHLREKRISQLVEAATEDQMLRAGNIGGELLNWIAMLGMFPPSTPAFLERQGDIGHAYGAWVLGD